MKESSTILVSGSNVHGAIEHCQCNLIQLHLQCISLLLFIAYQYNNMAAAAMMQSLYNQPSTFPMSSYIPDAHKIAQAIYASVR